MTQDGDTESSPRPQRNKRSMKLEKKLCLRNNELLVSLNAFNVQGDSVSIFPKMILLSAVQIKQTAD